MVDTTDERATGDLVLDEATELPTRVLVMGLAHEDGTLLAREIYPVADACGQSREQVRSCLRRLVAEGLYERDGEGRDAVFRATPDGVDALGANLARHRLAYAQDAAGRGWDGHWHLVAFAIPETKRHARDTFRDRLRVFGGAAIQNGLYVSPHRWENDVNAAAERLEVTEHLTLAVTDELAVGGTRDARQLARELWNIDELARRYESFIDQYQKVPEVLEHMRDSHDRLNDADFQPGALLTGLRFAECFEIDPLLPPELLPRPWPGRKAREVLARCRRLGMQVRAENDLPPLFQVWDEVFRVLP